MWQSEIDEEGVPSGIAIFDSDDATREYFMLYFDERKVSRKYEVSIDGSAHFGAFSQREAEAE